MKKTFLFLLGLMMVISLKATIKIADGQKYYFVCTQWPSGSIVLGENHSQSPLVYYDMETGQLSPDSYWILKKSDIHYLQCPKQAISGVQRHPTDKCQWRNHSQRHRIVILGNQRLCGMENHGKRRRCRLHRKRRRIRTVFQHPQSKQRHTISGRHL